MLKREIGDHKMNSKDMKEKDYKKLTEEYEKLNQQREDMYPLAIEDTFDVRRREIDLVCSKDSAFENKVKSLLMMADKGNPLLKLYLAFKKGDMEYLNDVLYENAQMEQITNVASPGTDHTYYSYNVMPALFAANMPDRIGLILPEENGLAVNSVSGTPIVNIFMGIWYRNHEFLDAGLAQAEKKLGQKITGFEKAYLNCFKDIALKDTASLETDLDELCKAHSKRRDFGMTAFSKGFCIEAHAVYNMLHWVYEGELQDKVKMPDQKNFCQELAIWQKDHDHQHGKVVTQYPDDIEIFNKMLYCEPPKMCLVTQGKERYIDVDKFARDVAARLQDMGETLSNKKNSPFSKLLQKIKRKN